jgi:hypothetical protein
LTELRYSPAGFIGMAGRQEREPLCRSIADTAFVDTAFVDTAFVDTAFADTAFADTAFADTAFKPTFREIYAN